MLNDIIFYKDEYEVKLEGDFNKLVSNELDCEKVLKDIRCAGDGHNEICKHKIFDLISPNHEYSFKDILIIYIHKFAKSNNIEVNSASFSSFHDVSPIYINGSITNPRLSIKYDDFKFIISVISSV